MIGDEMLLSGDSRCDNSLSMHYSSGVSGNGKGAMLESVDYSAVGHREEEEDSAASFMTRSFVSRIGKGCLTEQQASQLRERGLKFRRMYERLQREHSLLKSRFQRQDATATRMNSSARLSGAKSLNEHARRRRVALDRNCQLVESASHPMAAQAMAHRQAEDCSFPPLKDTKTLLLFEEATKLQDILGSIRGDLAQFDQFFQGVLEDRGASIGLLGEFVKGLCGKVGEIQECFGEYQQKVEELSRETQRTFSALDRYKVQVSNILRRYGHNDSDHSAKTKSKSSTHKSHEKCSEFDITTNFRLPLADVAENFSLAPFCCSPELERVIDEETRHMDSLTIGSTCVAGAKKKLEEYVRTIFFLRESVRGNQCLHVYLDNPTARAWVRETSQHLGRYRKCKEAVSMDRGVAVSPEAVMGCFEQNVSAVERELTSSRQEYTRKIQEAATRSEQLLLFIRNAYLSFSKVLLTNCVNVLDLGHSEDLDWLKAATRSIRSVGRLLVSYSQEVDPQHPRRTMGVIREEEEWLTQIVKKISQWSRTLQSIHDQLA